MSSLFSTAMMRNMVEMACLSYQPKYKIKTGLESFGFDTSKDRYFIENTHTGTQCFVAGDKDKIIVSFRGTEGTSLKDWATDVGMFKTHWTTQIQTNINESFGKLHHGFTQAVNSVYLDVLAEITRLRGNLQPIYVTGHSLGGALAVVFSAMVELTVSQMSIAGVYTFGQPRVGDHQFCRLFNNQMHDRCFRMVNNNDVVTRMPPQMLGYSHVGELKYFDHDGQFFEDGDDLSWWARFWDRLEGRYDDLFVVGTDGITDHGSDVYKALVNAVDDDDEFDGTV